MKTIEEIRRDRLEWLVQKHGGSIQRLANAVEKSHSQVSQVLRAVPHSKTGKPRVMGSDLAREYEARLGLAEGLMDTPVTESGDPIEGPVRQAQRMSFGSFTVPQKPLSWRELKTMEELPRVFEALLPDGAMGSDFPEGMRVEFEAASSAKIGEHVIVRDKHGDLHFRLCQQAKAGGWEAGAVGVGFRTLSPEEDGIEVIAVMTGYFVSRRRP